MDMNGGQAQIQMQGQQPQQFQQYQQQPQMMGGQMMDPNMQQYMQ